MYLRICSLCICMCIFYRFSGIFTAHNSIENCLGLNTSREVEIEVCFVLWLLELLLWHYLSKCECECDCECEFECECMCIWVNLRKLCGYLWLIEYINLHGKCAQMQCNFNLIGKSMEHRASLISLRLSNYTAFPVIINCRNRLNMHIL